MKGKAGGRPRESDGCTCDVIFSLLTPQSTERIVVILHQKFFHIYCVKFLLPKIIARENTKQQSLSLIVDFQFNGFTNWTKLYENKILHL
jgi:hypothetical protein